MAFEGLIKNVERRYRETSSETMKAEYETFMRITPCHACGGQRLKKSALAVTVGDKNIAEVTALSYRKIAGIFEWFGTDKDAGIDWRTDFEGNQGENRIFDGCRARLFNACSCDRKFVRWRGTKNPSCNTDWFRIGRRRLYFG